MDKEARDIRMGRDSKFLVEVIGNAFGDGVRFIGG